MHVLVFDTETTGLPKTKELSVSTLDLWPYIVQFSYIIYDTDTNRIVKTFDKIIKMENDIQIPQESTNIHGITMEISQNNGVSIEDVIQEYMGDMQRADLVVGHNISFDINMLKVTIKRMYLNEINMFKKRMYSHYNEYVEFATKYYCTMNKTIELCNLKQMGKNGKEYTKYPKLLELHTQLFNQPLKGLHNSLNDVAVCLRCYYKLAYDNDICTINNEIDALMNNLIVPVPVPI